jgi:multidrug efflux pump subunit AcrA (membrane-fusion protein)
MAEPKRAKPQAAVRASILFVVLGAVAFISWRYAHRSEGYTGGDVTATGTVEAVHLQLAFKVPGQIADMPVNEGDYVRAGQIVAGLEPRDFDVQINSARAALETARASVVQAAATREKNARDLERKQLLTNQGYGTPQQLDAAAFALTMLVLASTLFKRTL